MSALRAISHRALALFVDDGWLAIATLGVVIATAAMRRLFPSEPMLAGAMLVLGCFGAFVGSALSGARK